MSQPSQLMPDIRQIAPLEDRMDPEDWCTDEEFRHWQSGDARAFDNLYERFAPYLNGVVANSPQWRVLVRWYSREDVVQEVWAAVVATAGKSFEPRGKGSLGSWLSAVAHNEMKSLCRSHGSLKRGEGEVADPLATGVEGHASPKPGSAIPETPTSHARFSEYVERARARLDRREFLAWYYIELLDCSAHEAADAMGDLGGTASAVRALLMRAKWKLTQDLKDEQSLGADGST